MSYSSREAFSWDIPIWGIIWWEVELSDIQKEELRLKEKAKIIEELKSLKVIFDYTVCKSIIIHPSFDSRYNLKFNISSILNEFYQRSCFEGKTIDWYVNPKINRLKELNASKEDISELSFFIDNEIYWTIEIYSDKLTDSLMSLLWEDKSKKVISIWILKGDIVVYYNDSQEADIFSLELLEGAGKGLFIKFKEHIDLSQTDEQISQREKESGNTKLTYFWWALTLIAATTLVTWRINRYILKWIQFIDANWQLQTITLPKELYWETQSDVIKRALEIIKAQTWYEVKRVDWKDVFERSTNKIDIKSMRAELLKLNVHDYAKTNWLWEYWPFSKEVLVEAEKQKIEAISFLDSLERSNWPAISASRFLEFLRWSAWKSIHIILFPIFFTEILKNGWDLISYFKWAWEMATFMAWAKFAMLVLKKPLDLIPKGNLVWAWTYALLSLIFWVFWWWWWVAWWKWVAKYMELQQRFDAWIPESQDWFHKYMSPDWRDSNSLATAFYVWLWWFATELTDSMWMNLKIPWTPITFWSHSVDLSTNMTDYMSVWLTRTPEEYNNRLEEFWKWLWDELRSLVIDYKASDPFYIRSIWDLFSPSFADPRSIWQRFTDLSKDFNFWPESKIKDLEVQISVLEDKRSSLSAYLKALWFKLTSEEKQKKEKEILRLDHKIEKLRKELELAESRLRFARRNLLEQKIKDYIFHWENGWSEEENKEIKEQVYKMVMDNLDAMIDNPEVLEQQIAYIRVKLNWLKITDEMIEDFEYKIWVEKKMYEIAFWPKFDHEQIPTDISIQEMEAYIAFLRDPILQFINKLPEKDKAYAKRFYERTMAREEVVQEWDIERTIHVEYAADKQVSIYDRLIWDTSIDTESWKEKWQMFHFFTLMVKKHKKDTLLLDRLKTRQDIVDLRDPRVTPSMHYTDWFNVKFDGKRYILEHEWKMIFINVDTDWKMKRIHIEWSTYEPDVWAAWSILSPDFMAAKLDGGSAYPYIYFSESDSSIYFRRENLAFSWKFATMKKMSLEDFFSKVLFAQENGIYSINLIEDYEIYFDLSLERVDKK